MSIAAFSLLVKCCHGGTFSRCYWIASRYLCGFAVSPCLAYGLRLAR